MCEIKIGTCVRGNDILTVLPEVIKAGFETIELYYNISLDGTDFVELSKRTNEIIGDSGLRISSIGLYCNPLQYEEQRKELEYCIDNAKLFNARVIGTFAGALEGESVDDSMPKYKEVFSELAKRAEANNIKIGIENCPMYGFWYRNTCNIGFCPRSWEMMFDAVDSDNIGLEWEPSHQLEQFIDPIEQLKVWMPKIVHVHGKDANIDWQYIRKYGSWFGSHYSSHRFPGLGDSDWKQIITILNHGGYCEDIAIEGFHDPVYYGDREFEGQIMALDYLKRCQGR
jgi:sugar phosphate isomerase/epimerase